MLHLRALGDSATDSSSRDLVVDDVKAGYLIPPRRSLTRPGRVTVIAAQALTPAAHGATTDVVQYELSLCPRPRSSDKGQDAGNPDMLEKQ